MIYAFFPIVAAVCYGLGYVLMERTFKVINIPTYIFLSSFVGMFLALLLRHFTHESFTFSFIGHRADLLHVMATLLAGWSGGVITFYAIRGTSASYAAFGEISYPLFVLLFSFLLLGVRHFDWSLLVGGGLMITGAFILVYGRLKTA